MPSRTFNDYFLGLSAIFLNVHNVFYLFLKLERFSVLIDRTKHFSHCRTSRVASSLSFTRGDCNSPVYFSVYWIVWDFPTVANAPPELCWSPDANSEAAQFASGGHATQYMIPPPRTFVPSHGRAHFWCLSSPLLNSLSSIRHHHHCLLAHFPPPYPLCQSLPPLDIFLIIFTFGRCRSDVLIVLYNGVSLWNLYLSRIFIT